MWKWFLINPSFNLTIFFFNKSQLSPRIEFQPINQRERCRLHNHLKRFLHFLNSAAHKGSLVKRPIASQGSWGTERVGLDRPYPNLIWEHTFFLFQNKVWPCFRLERKGNSAEVDKRAKRVGKVPGSLHTMNGSHVCITRLGYNVTTYFIHLKDIDNQSMAVPILLHCDPTGDCCWVSACSFIPRYRPVWHLTMFFGIHCTFPPVTSQVSQCDWVLFADHRKLPAEFGHLCFKAIWLYPNKVLLLACVEPSLVDW